MNNLRLMTKGANGLKSWSSWNLMKEKGHLPNPHSLVGSVTMDYLCHMRIKVQTLVFNLATRLENFDSAPQLKDLDSTGSFFSFELFEKYLEIV